jgi:hypothetical protein
MSLKVSPMTMRSRPLLPIERFMVRLHENYQGCTTVTATARWQGPVDESRFRQALDPLQRRHAALRLRIVKEPNRFVKEPGDLRFELLDEPGPIPCRWVETDDPSAWQAESLRLAYQPFDAGASPLARVTVLHGPSDGWSDVLWTVHHAVCDGRSLLILNRDLLDLYRDPSGGSLPPLPSWPQQRQLRQRASHVRSLASVVGLAWQRWRLRHAPPAIIPVQRAGLDTICRLVLPPELTARLLARARREGTTMYGILTAALLKTGAEHDRLLGQRMFNRSPVCTRDWYHPPGDRDEVGCFVSAVIGWRRIVAGQDVWKLARDCRAEVTRYLRSNGPLWTEFMVGRGQTLQGETTNCTINSLGVFPASRVAAELPGPVLSEFSWVANARGFTTQLWFACVTLGDRLNITLHSQCHGDEGLAELAEQFVKRLTAAAA